PRELARFLAAQISYPSESSSEAEDLASVATYFEIVAGRRSLLDELAEVYSRYVSPTAVHRFLAANPAPPGIFTPDYDDLLERSFQEAGRPYDLVVPPDPTDQDLSGQILWWQHGVYEPQVVAANQLRLDLESQTVICKLRGHVDRSSERWNSYVVSEQ